MFGFLKRLFGGNREEPAVYARGRKLDLDLGERLVRLQRDYWRPAPDEKAALVAREDALSPIELLRLHHLTCLDLLALIQRAALDDELGDVDAPDGEDLDRCTRLLPRLAGPEGPFRPRHALVWQARGGAAAGGEREPDLRGALTNASVSHLGALEIVRLQGTTPVTLEFLAFDDIASIDIGPPSLFRPARIYLEREGDEFIPGLLSLLYGCSWESPNEYDKDGTMTRFAFHVERALGERGLGLGVGHQDFTFADGGVLFGMGSLESIVFPLDASAPDFERRCRKRGLDPQEMRVKVAR